jgi:Adenosine deaminase
MSRYPASAPEQVEFFKKMPKVDLHRHLEGSLRVETMLEVIQEHNLSLPDRQELPSLVQIQPADALNSSTFLSKIPDPALFLPFTGNYPAHHARSHCRRHGG